MQSNVRGVPGWLYIRFARKIHCTFPAAPSGAIPARVFKTNSEMRWNDTRLLQQYYGPAHTDTATSRLISPMSMSYTWGTPGGTAFTPSLITSTEEDRNSDKHLFWQYRSPLRSPLSGWRWRYTSTLDNGIATISGHQSVDQTVQKLEGVLAAKGVKRFAKRSIIVEKRRRSGYRCVLPNS
jgi:hypothetical protein